jgi:hypothetical protein
VQFHGRDRAFRRLTRRFVLVLVVPTSPRRLKLREATSGRLSLESGAPGVMEYWPPASLGEALRAGVWEYCAKSELHARSGLEVLANCISMQR